MSSRKPRIHWVSPLPPAETDIAHYTRRILPELSSAFDLTLWTDAPKWSLELEQFGPVRRFTPAQLTPRLMRRVGGDHPATVFVQMGNSWVFHSHILALCLRMPTVLVLHDVALQEMYLDAISNDLLDKDTYLSSMSTWYGKDGLSTAEQTMADNRDRFALAKLYPGFELAMRHATAVVTHTPAAAEMVHARRSVPVYCLDLPFQATPNWSSHRNDSGPLRLVQFGYTGPNRRLETVLEALSAMGPDFDFMFDVYGPLWNPDHIRAVSERLSIGARVTLHGYVPEPQLDAAIANAHLVFNLRNPTMGEASGSQLRIWNAGTASVVTNHGWYGTLPDECVFKVSSEHELSDLIELLSALQDNRHLGAKPGVAGRKQLETRYSPERYVAGLLAIAAEQERDARDMCLTEAAKRALSSMPPETRILASHHYARIIDDLL